MHDSTVIPLGNFKAESKPELCHKEAIPPSANFLEDATVSVWVVNPFKTQPFPVSRHVDAKLGSNRR